MIILICAIFFAVFSSLAYPMIDAKAGPVVGGIVPGGITVGTGVYVGAALIVAAGAGAVGYDEYGDEINNHAHAVWDGGTQLAKDSLMATVDLATGAGNAVTSLGSDYINYMNTTGLRHLEGRMAQLPMYQYNVGSTTRPSYAGDIGITVRHNMEAHNLVGAGRTMNSIQINVQTHADATYRRLVITTGTTELFRLTGKDLSKAQTDSVLNLLKDYANVKTSTIQSILQTYWTSFQLATVGGAAAVEAESYTSAVSRMREAWQEMVDAGLVLPVDSAIPYTPTNSPARYNEEAGTYTGVDGGVYNPADMNWRLPNVRWRDKSENISVPGVYVDTPVLTGNPEFDETHAKDKPKTTTNVFTGTTTANPDVPLDTPTTPPTTTTPGIPDFGKPGTTGLNFKPFLQSGEMMSKKFPFSIPFDFIMQLQVLNVEPEAPLIKINVEDYLKIGGYTIPFKMNVDFSMFDPVAAIVRWGLIVVFDISLIFAIRKLMPE